jgi:hypothetical protein
MNVGQVTLGLGLTLCGLGCAADVMSAAATAATYPSMAPVAQYLSPSPADEIALARSAAPPPVAADAGVLVLGSKGYQSAAQGKNGFVCMVMRSWSNNFDSPDFWNPKVRAPICFNAAAARSILPPYLKRTEWALSGASKQEILKRVQTALAAHEIAAPDTGSMAYMLSKDGYLNDDVAGHWHPHVMFYLPRTSVAQWGANIGKTSTIFADPDALEPQTVFFVPVKRWSDGTMDEMSAH